VDFFRARRERARGTRAHVRNIPSSVYPKSTVQSKFQAVCTLIYTLD
jgi:hypothetical protein